MTLRSDDEINKMLFDGDSTGGRLYCNSIKIRRHEGQVIAEFLLNGRTLMTTPMNMPNFDEGEVLTIQGIDAFTDCKFGT